MKKIASILFALFAFNSFSQETLTSSLTEFYNGIFWANSTKIEYSYDNFNRLEEEIQYSWLGTFWLQTSKISYSYNENRGIIERTYESTYSIGNDSVDVRIKTQYSYNNNKEPIEILVLNWDGSDYENYLKTVTNFENGKGIESLIYYWIDSDWAFSNELPSRNSLNYNSEGVLIDIVEDKWNGSDWELYGKTTYTYNGSNLISKYDNKLWDGSSWNDNDKYEYLYDNNRNVTKETRTSIEDGLEYTSIYEFEYDPTTEMVNLIHPFTDKTGYDYITEPNLHINKLTSSTFTNSTRTTYFYDDSTVGLNRVPSLDFSVFPNPTPDFIKVESRDFEFNKLSLYNVLGEKVMSSKSKKMNLTDLASGVYILKVISEKGEVATKKVIKN